MLEVGHARTLSGARQQRATFLRMHHRKVVHVLLAHVTEARLLIPSHARPQLRTGERESRKFDVVTHGLDLIVLLPKDDCSQICRIVSSILRHGKRASTKCSRASARSGILEVPPLPERAKAHDYFLRNCGPTTPAQIAPAYNQAPQYTPPQKEMVARR